MIGLSVGLPLGVLLLLTCGLLFRQVQKQTHILPRPVQQHDESLYVNKPELDSQHVAPSLSRGPYLPAEMGGR